MAGKAAILRRLCARAFVAAGHAGDRLACELAHHKLVSDESLACNHFPRRFFDGCGRGVAGTALSLPEVRRPLADATRIWPETAPILRKMRNKNRGFHRAKQKS